MVPSPDKSTRSEAFVRQLTENQPRLYGYVYSLIGEHSRAADVVQETNLVLWRKIDEFDPAKPFLPWAFAIARYQVLANVRDSNRDRLLLDENLVEKLSHLVEEQAEQFDLVRSALRPCLQSLTESNRELIQARYLKETPISELAGQLGRKAGAIKVALVRIRRQLASCVEKRIAEEMA